MARTPPPAGGELVYSTDAGRMCPGCRRPLADGSCKQAAAAAAVGDGHASAGRDSKARGGKTVTLVRGLALDAPALAALGKRLRSACGSGSTAKDGVTEVQGDHVERMMALLTDAGIRCKRSGH